METAYADGVDGEDLTLRAMTAKGKVISEHERECASIISMSNAPALILLYVLNGNAAFNRGASESSLVREASDCPRLLTQRRVQCLRNLVMDECHGISSNGTLYTC